MEAIPMPDKQFWNTRWENAETGWDLGEPSPPLTRYIDRIQNRHLSILIPGCGNAWEATYLADSGFTDITILDIAPAACHILRQRFADKNAVKVMEQDFFEHTLQYDLILEQTFFCALHPSLRQEYVKKMFQLLKPKGRLAGLLFHCNFETDGPPFGGDVSEYLSLFAPYFDVISIEPADNSVTPRAGREVFFETVRKEVKMC